MKKIALLRGVTPVGKNKIPKMSYLVELLEGPQLKNVKTYIQSGNILFESTLPENEIKEIIHNTIKDKIGADLEVILKDTQDLIGAVNENPFTTHYDQTRVHLVFTNSILDTSKLMYLQSMDFGDERFAIGSSCIYIYLPRDAEKKKLNTNYLEKVLGVKMTMRKLNVVKHLSAL